MNTKIYRLVYCSRNRIPGSVEEVNVEIQEILAKSRKNNAEAGVTGALLYNSGIFAQILEGSLSAVEATFERVQQDVRHSEVTLVENGPITARSFGNWSMALCAGVSASAIPLTTAAFAAAFADSAGAGVQILELLKNLVWQESDSVFT